MFKETEIPLLLNLSLPTLENYSIWMCDTMCKYIFRDILGVNTKSLQPISTTTLAILAKTKVVLWNLIKNQITPTSHISHSAQTEWPVSQPIHLVRTWTYHLPTKLVTVCKTSVHNPHTCQSCQQEKYQRKHSRHWVNGQWIHGRSKNERYWLIGYI